MMDNLILCIILSILLVFIIIYVFNLKTFVLEKIKLYRNGILAFVLIFISAFSIYTVMAKQEEKFFNSEPFKQLNNQIVYGKNNDILSNYVIGADEQISFNGSLLKRANILLEDIKADISLKINIITQNNETHSVDINIEIPLESTNKQIYDGPINIQKENLKYNF